MKTSSAKAKGRDLQKYIAKTIVDYFNGELTEDDVTSRSMGCSGVDVLMSPKAQGYFPVSIESKNTKTRPGPAELAQAESNKYEGTVAAVVWKPKGKSKKDTMIMLKLDDMLKFSTIVRHNDYGKKTIISISE